MPPPPCLSPQSCPTMRPAACLDTTPTSTSSLTRGPIPAIRRHAPTLQSPARIRDGGVHTSSFNFLDALPSIMEGVALDALRFREESILHTSVSLDTAMR